MLKRRCQRALLSVVLLTIAVSAQVATPIPAATTAPAQPITFEKQLRKAITFVQQTCIQDGKEIPVSGTGFFVSIAEKRIGPEATFVYLITNRHVAMAWDANNQPLQIKNTQVRMNLKNGKSMMVQTGAGSFPWFFPENDSTDLAAVPVSFSNDVFDYETIPDTMLVTDELISQRSISEGMKILFSGLFYSFPGETRMQPIVRAGIIAMMPDEELITTTRKKGKVYLGDVHAFHGNSGSPVFVDIAGRRGGVTTVGEDFKMLGVISGFYGEDDKFTPDS
jgi:hypothetical protein